MGWYKVLQAWNLGATKMHCRLQLPSPVANRRQKLSKSTHLMATPNAFGIKSTSSTYILYIHMAKYSWSSAHLKHIILNKNCDTWLIHVCHNQWWWDDILFEWEGQCKESCRLITIWPKLTFVSCRITQKAWTCWVTGTIPTKPKTDLLVDAISDLLYIIISLSKALSSTPIGTPYSLLFRHYLQLTYPVL